MSAPLSAPLPFAPRRCRRCHGIEPAVRFAALSRTLCTTCRDTDRRAQAQRRDRGATARDARPERNGRSSAHLAWVRDWPCAVRARGCGSIVHAHHVRLGTGGGTGIKPADRWAVPLCPCHHAELHTTGALTFQAKYAIDLRALAMHLARMSPHLLGEAANEP